MTWKAAYVLVAVVSLGAGTQIIATEAGVARPSDSPSRERLRRSDVVLMPEGMPASIRAFAPLRPTVVAWGNDPVHSTPDELRREARARGFRSA